jgi:putative transposase
MTDEGLDVIRSHIQGQRGRDDPLIHPHAVYLALGPNVTERCVAYRALFNEAIDEQLAEIRAYVQQQRALGNDQFQRLIETELGRCTRVRPAHRPRRDAEPMPEKGAMTPLVTPSTSIPLPL